MLMDRVIGFGVTERQARTVFVETRGLKAAAERLGVDVTLAQRWAQELGVEVRPYVPPRRPHEHRFSDEQARAAILSRHTLTRAAMELGVTPPALLRRARLLGLPTDPPGRDAYRAAVCGRAAA